MTNLELNNGEVFDCSTNVFPSPSFGLDDATEGNCRACRTGCAAGRTLTGVGVTREGGGGDAWNTISAMRSGRGRRAGDPSVDEKILRHILYI